MRNVINAQKDDVFRIRMNSEIKNELEEVFAKNGLTLTDAVNVFFQQVLNTGGFPFSVTEDNAEKMKAKALSKLMKELEIVLNLIQKKKPKKCWVCKMKIIYKKAAIDDLLNTENYIINQFHNDQAAKKLKNNIVDTISLLKNNPYLGPKMSDRFDIDTPFRYLIVSKQLVFYNVNEENIEIIRILDSRQDYLSLLF